MCSSPCYTNSLPAPLQATTTHAGRQPVRWPSRSGTSRCASRPSTSKKTCDTVEHSCVWTALREQGIEERYIQLLTKLYDQQRASVDTDVESKHLHVALVQPIPAIHRETTNRKVEEMQPRSQICRTRPQHVPLQPQICRRQSSRKRLTEADDHHAVRPNRSHDGTQPTPHEN